MNNSENFEWTYDKFVDWATEQLIDAIITGGFSKVKNTLRHIILNVLCMNIKSILPQFFKE